MANTKKTSGFIRMQKFCKDNKLPWTVAYNDDVYTVYVYPTEIGAEGAGFMTDDKNIHKACDTVVQRASEWLKH